MVRDGDLFRDIRGGHPLQVLQVRVEEVGVDQRDLQQRLDDVTDRAVIRETDLLCCGDEVPQAATTKYR